MKKDKILDYIHKIFAEYPSHLKNGVVDEDQLTRCHDATILFSGKTWTELMDVDLYHSEDAIICINNLAFSYYIAAYLKLFIEKYYEADALVDTILNKLTPPVRNGEPRPAWIEKNIDFFSYEKKAVISFTLQYLCIKYNDQNAEKALSIYWGQYLNESLLLNNIQGSKNNSK